MAWAPPTAWGVPVSRALAEVRGSVPLGWRLGLIALYCVTISAWSRSVVVSRRPGWPRFLAAMPVLLGNCLLPLLFSADSEVCTRTGIAFCFVWLCNAKVLGAAVGRGPLCLPLSAAQFGVVLVVPVTPRLDGSKGKGMPRVGSMGSLGLSGGSTLQLLGSFLIKVLCLCLVVFLVTGVQLPRIIMEVVYALGLFSFLGCIMDGPASLATALIGLPISPHFDRPYAATSLASFWSRRWNLTASNTLRFLVYDVLTEGRIVGVASSKPPQVPRLRKVLAMMASFVSSGLIHEVMFWYTQHRFDGRWLAFFSLQGPLLVLEGIVRSSALQRGIKIPQLVSVGVTLAVLLTSGDWLFFPPPVESGLATQVVESIKATFEAVAAAATR